VQTPDFTALEQQLHRHGLSKGWAVVIDAVTRNL